jgi:flagellar basal-body rod protein FlgF/flagellar basal-body rod protein FlgG
MIDRLQHSMRALQMFMQAQEVTANNLANINTPGFKGDKLFYRAFADELNGQLVSGVETHQSMRMQQGAFESTDNPFDFAIEGKGFFVIENENGQFLTRNGRFKLDSEGFLVDKQGGMVQGEGGPIHLPQLIKSGATSSDVNINVAKDGTISVEGEEVGKLQVVQVDQIATLQRRTNSYLAVPEETQMTTDESSQIVQGFYESGNVDPLMELVDMTRNMRMFESQQRAMRTTDEMLSQATTRLGRF